jgi:hypothetical protein
MLSLNVYLDGEGCWPDLKARGFITGQLVGIARLPKGTQAGKSSVTVRIETAEGQVILAETTLALLTNAVNAFNAAEMTTLGKEMK